MILDVDISTKSVFEKCLVIEITVQASHLPASLEIYIEAFWLYLAQENLPKGTGLVGTPGFGDRQYWISIKPW